MIQELERAKRSMRGRNTRLKKAQSAAAPTGAVEAELGSLASSTDSSLRGGGLGYGGAALFRTGGGRDSHGGGGGRGSYPAVRPSSAEERRFSRFAVSLNVPRPTRHDEFMPADAIESVSGGGGTTTTNNNNSGAKDDGAGKGGNDSGGASRKRSSSAKNGQGAASAASGAAAVGSGSKLRLDIVRADVERGVGLTPRSPRPGGVAPARFDSAAKELLQGYEEEQVTPPRKKRTGGSSRAPSCSIDTDDGRTGPSEGRFFLGMSGRVFGGPGIPGYSITYLIVAVLARTGI